MRAWKMLCARSVAAAMGPRQVHSAFRTHESMRAVVRHVSRTKGMSRRPNRGPVGMGGAVVRRGARRVGRRIEAECGAGHGKSVWGAGQFIEVSTHMRTRVRAGESSAFAELFDSYARAVYNHAFRLTADWSTPASPYPPRPPGRPARSTSSRRSSGAPSPRAPTGPSSPNRTSSGPRSAPLNIGTCRTTAAVTQLSCRPGRRGT